MIINYLELEVLLMQLLIFAPRMAPLDHIYTYVNNMAVQGCANQSRVSMASSVGTILQDIALVSRRQHIHASAGSVPGEEN